jgi:hypothetical protein
VNPFLNFRLQPSFGQNLVVVAWDTPDECLGGQYYVYRSAKGVRGTWEILNDYAPVSHGVSHWADDGQVVPPAGDTIYYRMLYIAPDGTEYDSDAIDLWGVLPREEYGMVRMIMDEEFRQMRFGGGVQVWHCIPLASGVLADNLDPATMQPRAAPCPGGDNYGQPYKGGFYTPIQTWVNFGDVTNKSEDRDDGFGFNESIDIQCRFLAFPRVRRSHMLVNPRTDDRYVVDSEVKPFLHRGVVPVAYEATLKRIGQDDYRRTFPVPEFTPVGFP